MKCDHPACTSEALVLPAWERYEGYAWKWCLDHCHITHDMTAEYLLFVIKHSGNNLPE